MERELLKCKKNLKQNITKTFFLLQFKGSCRIAALSIEECRLLLLPSLFHVRMVTFVGTRRPSYYYGRSFCVQNDDLSFSYFCHSFVTFLLFLTDLFIC